MPRTTTRQTSRRPAGRRSRSVDRQTEKPGWRRLWTWLWSQVVRCRRPLAYRTQYWPHIYRVNENDGLCHRH